MITLSSRLREYAAQRTMAFEDGSVKYRLSWPDGEDERFIEIDKRSFILHAGVISHGTITYARPAPLGFTPLEEQLDSYRSVGPGDVHFLRRPS